MLKHFSLQITIRIGIFILLVLLLIYVTTQTSYYISIFMLSLLVLLAFYNIFSYVDQTNQEISSFLQGIKYNDFGITFTSRKKGESFRELYEAFNGIAAKFKNIQAEKEANHLYLQTVVENVSVGLLCVNEDGKISIMNKAMKTMLSKQYLINLKSLEKLEPNLYGVIEKMKSGEEELVKLDIDNKLIQASVKVNEFWLRNEYYKLIAIQNIQSELEEQELASWQKLIRILTHEIMNSVTPIVSLTAAIDDLLGEEGRELTEQELKDIKLAIKAVGKRSQGLLRFTETYRTLTKIPPPNFERMDAVSLVSNISTLFKTTMKEKGIKLTVNLPKVKLPFQGDIDLLEQVLINLIKNATEACASTDNPEITLNVFKHKNHRIVIQIIDNGSGIDDHTLEQIFVPFYTTKREGTGIGLSISRQIIKMHKGNITVNSELGEGTVFTIDI